MSFLLNCLCLNVLEIFAALVFSGPFFGPFSQACHILVLCIVICVLEATLNIPNSMLLNVTCVQIIFLYLASPIIDENIKLTEYFMNNIPLLKCTVPVVLFSACSSLLFSCDVNPGTESDLSPQNATTDAKVLCSVFYCF